MSDLALNKIFGAVLATGLVILGLRQASEMIFTVEGPEKPGYAIEVKEEAAGPAAAADVPPDWGTVLPVADTAAGQVVSTKCASCHNFVAGGPDMTGPGLYGVIGRKPGGHPGFAYSGGLTEFGAKTPAWDYDNLYEFLAAPQKYIAGTKMTFVGLKKPEERIALIAWLRTQSASPAAIPAPKPAAAAPAAEAATAAPAASAPVAGAPASATSDSPTGQAPTTGAAEAPTAPKVAPGAKAN